MNAYMHRRSISLLSTGMIVGALALSNLAAGDEMNTGADDSSRGGSYAADERILVPSSDRFRDNMTEFHDALQVIDRIGVVAYNDRRDVSGARRVGFIGADVADVLPDAVTVDAAGEVSEVDHAAILPLAVESIRQLRAENAALRADNAALRYEIAILRARMARMETALQQLPHCGNNDTPTED